MNDDIITIADHYGWRRQSDKCIEECSELIKALLKFRYKWGSAAVFLRGRSEEKNEVVGELADVLNMVDQIIYLMDIREKVDAVRAEKIARQLKRIQNGE